MQKSFTVPGTNAPPDGYNFSFYASLMLGLLPDRSKPVVPTMAFCFTVGPVIWDVEQAKVHFTGKPLIRVVGTF